MTKRRFYAIIILAFAGVAHLVERDLAKVEVASSSLVARSKKERHPCGCLSFLEQHFCYAKVVACGRVIEREWGNPSKVPPSQSPFLAVGGSADNKTCGQSKETPPRVVFFWKCTAAPVNPLPRPARSASNQEVRQGSCEWRQPFVGCREASSSLVARSKTPPHRVVFFCVRLGAHRRVSRLPAATAADSRDTSSKAPRFIRHRRRFGAFLVARGRVIEREWGNPSKVPPSHSPFLAVGGSADNKTCGRLKKHHPGWCFFLECRGRA